MRIHTIQKADSYSKEIEEIISKPPAFLLRWGIPLILLWSSVLLVLCNYVKYPEVQKMPVQVIYPNANQPANNAQPGHPYKGNTNLHNPAFYAYVSLGTRFFKYLKKGSRIKVSFNDISNGEKGYIRGTIFTVNKDNLNNDLTAVIKLGPGQNKYSGPIPGSTGIAEVVTSETTFLNKILANFRRLFI